MNRLTPADYAHIEKLREQMKERRKTWFGLQKTTRAEVAEFVLTTYVPRLLEEIEALKAVND